LETVPPVTYTEPPSSTPPSTEPVVLPIVIGDQTPTTTAAPATETPTTAAALPSSLPVTGSASTMLALVGLVAVLLGAGLIFMGRRPPADA
jgi:LPXTG-motif cell wall-anchored protein